MGWGSGYSPGPPAASRGRVLLAAGCGENWFGTEVMGGAVGKMEFEAQGQHIPSSLYSSWCFSFGIAFCSDQCRRGGQCWLLEQRQWEIHY